MKKEVKILGAGISGLVCGITLARAGYKVTIYEKNKSCGKRFNNDFQGIENWSTKKDIVDILKEIGIKINFLCKPQYTVKMYDKKLKCATVRTGNPIFYLVKRGTDKQSLDTGLKKQAIKAGVKIKFNKTINKEKCDVIATGPTCADAIAKGITFETSLPNMNVIILNDELAPKGYVYFFINNKKGILAICIFRHFNKEKEYFDKALNQIKKMYDCDFRNIKEFGGYGNFFIEKN